MKRTALIVFIMMLAVSFYGCDMESETHNDISDSVPSHITESSDTTESWKKEFEKSLLEQYGVTPDRYEDLGDGIFQVYVIIDGKSVPYVTVDSNTGEYHG